MEFQKIADYLLDMSIAVLAVACVGCHVLNDERKLSRKERKMWLVMESFLSFRHYTLSE